MKTAKQLGLTEKQYCGLVRTLDALKRIPFAGRESKWSSVKGDSFHMNTWKREHRCGTVHCIGGWAQRFGGEGIIMEAMKNSGLGNLFCPMTIGDWNDITPDKAAKALANYLKTGNPDWDKVMKERVIKRNK